MHHRNAMPEREVVAYDAAVVGPQLPSGSESNDQRGRAAPVGQARTQTLLVTASGCLDARPRHGVLERSDRSEHDANEAAETSEQRA